MLNSMICSAWVLLGCACLGASPAPVLFVSSTPPDLVETQSAVIKNFYTIALSHDRGGLPSVALTKKVAPYLSKGLLESISRARKAEQLFLKSSPDPGPSDYEGYPFVSPGEGATRITSIKPDQKYSANTYYVELCSISKKDGKPYDPMAVRVRLIFESGRWLIDDIYYYQDTSNPSPSGLRAYLKPSSSEKQPAK